MGAGGKALLGHGAFQETLAVCGKFAEGVDVPGTHLGVAIEFFPWR